MRFSFNLNKTNKFHQSKTWNVIRWIHSLTFITGVTVINTHKRAQSLVKLKVWKCLPIPTLRVHILLAKILHIKILLLSGPFTF